MKKISLQRIPWDPRERTGRIELTLPSSPRMRLQARAAPEFWIFRIPGPNDWSEERFAASLRRWMQLIPWLRTSISPEGQALSIHQSPEPSWETPNRSKTNEHLLWHIKISRTSAEGCLLELRSDARLGDPLSWQDWISALLDIYADRQAVLSALPDWKKLASSWLTAPSSTMGMVGKDKETAPDGLTSHSWTWTPEAQKALVTLASQSLKPAFWAGLTLSVLDSFADAEKDFALYFFELRFLNEHAARFPRGQRIAKQGSSSWSERLYDYELGLAQEAENPPELNQDGIQIKRCAFSILNKALPLGEWCSLAKAVDASLHLYFSDNPQSSSFAILAGNEFPLAFFRSFIAALDQAIQETLSHTRSPTHSSSGKPSRSPLLSLSQAPSAVAEPKGTPLTPSQERMLYIETLDPGTTVHHLNGAWTLSAGFDKKAFQKALDALVIEHEALRCNLRREGANTVVEVQPPFSPELRHDRIAAGSDLSSHILEISKKPFNLGEVPNFRLGLIERDDGSQVFYLITHHIFWDGFSSSVFWRQLQAHYRRAGDGAKEKHKPLSYNFSDYARGRQLEIESGELDEQMEYWKKRFTPIPEPLELATDWPRPKDFGHDGATVWIPWDADFDAKLQTFVKERGCTLYHLLLSAIFALLHRISGQEDLVVGTPIHGRNRAEFFELLGNFINVLAMRATCQPQLGFEALLASVKSASQESLAYADLPFEKLIAALKIPRDPSRTPLYTTMLFFQDHSLEQISLDGAEVFPVPLPCRTVDTDMVFSIERFSQQTFAALHYRTDLWEKPSVEAIALGFRQLLEGILEAPQAPLSSFRLLSDPKMGQAPRQDLKKRPPYPDLNSWLASTAAQNPSKEAVRTLGGQSLTYAALEEKALRLAGLLASEGVSAASVVGVCLNREIDLIVALRAILRVGAAYLPLDPLYPSERLQYMVQDAKVAVIVSELEFKDLFPAIDQAAPRLLCIDREHALIEGHKPLGSEVNGPTPDDLAYIIYTSGSTGKPKGVEISHRAAVHFLQAIREKLELPEGLRTLAITTISFDISVLEIFSTLTLAGTVILVSADRVSDGAYLSEALQRESIDLLQATPATWRLLLGSGWKGKSSLFALSGGEALTRDLARELTPRVGQLWNVYGPTEATVWATAELIVDPEAPICIGSVLPSYEAYIFDARGQALPQGSIGQLYLAGPALARGYRFRPDLTVERFLPHPLEVEARMYDTGDLARVRADGRLEYISRRDSQVKLRGFRIELGEIEASMMSHPSISQAACLVRELSPGDQRLLAYAVLRKGQSLGLASLVQHLGHHLPRYMMPQNLMILGSMPLTGSGKIDKKALPPPTTTRDETAPPPLTESLSPAEAKISAIFGELLDRRDVKASDNFFDLGGHSLLALKALHRFQEELDLSLKIRDLLLLSVAQLAALHFGNRPLARSPGDRR